MDGLLAWLQPFLLLGLIQGSWRNFLLSDHLHGFGEWHPDASYVEFMTFLLKFKGDQIRKKTLLLQRSQSDRIELSLRTHLKSLHREFPIPFI